MVVPLHDAEAAVERLAQVKQYERERLSELRRGAGSLPGSISSSTISVEVEEPALPMLPFRGSGQESRDQDPRTPGS